MQPDTEITTIPPQDDDEDLFGSPPPSPGRGRSPSPGLALPSSSSGIALISQNVGTIALPGSQHNSELAVNPIALPFSDIRHGSPWPPANALSHARPSRSSSRCSSASAGGSGASVTPTPTPSVSRASSRPPSPRRKRKARAQTPSVRPPPPEIPLPDPSAPPPPNWLRSQSALLGHAGLVGGVKPANISHGQHRGSTPSNPIVIDDSIDSTSEQRAADRPTRISRHSSYFGMLGNRKLPAPETRDVVDILIRQKEVLPILRDLFKLLSRNPGLASAYRSGGGIDPPPKRRKLNHVPAGAVDWDVPYPFQQGEGPQSYHDGWVQNRAKQLVSQLVTLIRTASRKAALRRFLKEEHGFREKLEQQRAESLQVAALFKEIEHSLPKANGHYKPDTSFYGTDKSTVPETPQNQSPTPSEFVKVACSDTSPSSDPAQAPGPLDHLISSLLTTTPIAQSTLDISPDISPNSTCDTGDVDSLFDNWMSIFQSFPTEQHQDILSSTLPSQGAAANPIAIDTPMNFGSWSFPESSSTTQSPSTDLGGIASFGSSTSNPQPMEVDNDVTHKLPDIDSLFGLPSASSTSHTDSLSVTIPKAPVSGTPSLSASPIPSSMGDFPMTPTPGVGDELHTNLGFGMNFGNGNSNDTTTGVADDVMNAVNSLMALGGNENAGDWDGFDSGDSVGCNLLGADSNQDRTESEIQQPTPTAAKMDSQGGKGAVLEERNGSISQEELAAAEAQEEEDVQTVNSVIPVLMSSVLPMTIPVGAQNVGTSSVFTPQTVKPHAKRALDRKELLKIAKERRKQLADEIVKTRIQLWETTVENGVLAHLSKFYV